MPERPLILFAAPTIADKEKSTAEHQSLLNLHMIVKKQELLLNLQYYKMHLKKEMFKSRP